MHFFGGEPFCNHRAKEPVNFREIRNLITGNRLACLRNFAIDGRKQNRADFTLLRDVVSANLAHAIKVSSLV